RNDADPDVIPSLRYYNDSDTLQIIGCTSPTPGQGTVQAVTEPVTLSGQLGQSTGVRLYYTPPSSSWSGTATFTYTIADRFGAQSTATVTVKVVTALVNQAPIVYAGPDLTVDSMSPLETKALIVGSATDDGLPLNQTF